MIIDELSHDDIVQAIEHLHDACACREDCSGCFYADYYGVCILRSIPAEWRPGALIWKGGDSNDQD